MLLHLQINCYSGMSARSAARDRYKCNFCWVFLVSLDYGIVG